MTSSLFSPGGLPVPALSDEPNIPADLAELTDALDPTVVARFTSTTERDSTWAASVAPVGSRCYITGTRRQYIVWLESTGVTPAWYPLTLDGLLSVVNNAARDALLAVEGLGVFVTSTGATYRYTSGAWIGGNVYGQDRIAFANTGTSVASLTKLHTLVTIPAVGVPCRIILLAEGKAGFAAAAPRAIRWVFTDLPGTATNVAQDENTTSINVNDTATWQALTASLRMDLPANVAGTFRTQVVSDGSAWHSGHVIWTRTAL
jgi:hypothetical protein